MLKRGTHRGPPGSRVHPHVTAKEAKDKGQHQLAEVPKRDQEPGSQSPNPLCHLLQPWGAPTGQLSALEALASLAWGPGCLWQSQECGVKGRLGPRAGGRASGKWQHVRSLWQEKGAMFRGRERERRNGTRWAKVGCVLQTGGEFGLTPSY